MAFSCCRLPLPSTDRTPGAARSRSYGLGSCVLTAWSVARKKNGDVLFAGCDDSLRAREYLSAATLAVLGSVGSVERHDSVRADDGILPHGHSASLAARRVRI
jgi:hypothetical protein